jgi:hypothetical protein
MANIDDPLHPSIGDIIDRVERMREDLLIVQNFLEKFEPRQSAISQDGKGDSLRNIVSRGSC